MSDDEDPKSFQCDCGGNLEERRSISDVRNKHGRVKPVKEVVIVSNESKEELFRRGYKIIHEEEDMYTFSKDVTVMPIWLLVVIAILLFPIGTIIAVLAYFLWRKPKIKVVKKID